eukprot:TRINITY_DN4864_c0_g1_i1.p1 TRINITY_DN4864_c0_g1~~TRINITY_DN4864_c0_g1_i1.p1  ORF type:complete len:156 (+),score=22.52 TRINITY_DN4864_c0_g1_i1:109-576(+)
MSSEVAQHERAFQRQPTVSYNPKKGGDAVNSKRYVRPVGLGFKTPDMPRTVTSLTRNAIHGNVRIRGRILTGVVRKQKMQRTIIIRRDYLHFVKKYGRFEKRHNNMAVHMSPAFLDVELGDIVTVGECRPLSKTVRFNVIKHTKPPGQKKQFTKF